jgi:aspartyl-tRNA(Asn)/glutamyl-tRNA(Gln) amidotransferase subunit A
MIPRIPPPIPARFPTWFPRSAAVKGMKIGIPKEYRVDGMPSRSMRFGSQGAQWLKEQGAEIVEISLPMTKYALPAYYIIAPAEASSNLARYDGMRFGVRVEGEDLTDTYEKTRGPASAMKCSAAS